MILKRRSSVGDFISPHNCTDFGYFEEELYKTKKGTWFLFGKGGALSPYAISVSGGTGEGQSIRVLTEEEAQEWAEEKLTVEEYLELFDCERG